jgi:Putative addiction module component
MMNPEYKEIEASARRLPLSEKAQLACTLIRDLDEDTDGNVEELWIAEADRRLDAYLKGEIEAVDGDVAMSRLRHRLK